ncbi:MAG: lipopolysaccharide transport periplasmic protein LptA [Hydrogenovibrio sp.]|nr:lipopolysaccharide transport periplasmic protein LptA [Hydrogenovibrio sp.]
MLKPTTNLVNRMIDKTTVLLLAFAFAATPFAASAQTQTQNDEEKLPIEVTADTLSAKDKEGISIYTGNVIITQGTTTITGDKVTLHHPNRKVSTAIVVGTPATFRRYIPDEKNWVNGKADKITYTASKRTVLLEGNAQVVQEGKNSISGPEILYNVKEKTLFAKGNKKEQKRIKMIFTPDNEQEKDSP